MALTLVTLFRHLLFELRYSILIALIHSSSPTTNFTLLTPFLTQWLCHVLAVMDSQNVMIRAVAIITAHNVNLRTNAFVAFQTPHTLHILVYVTLIIVQLHSVNQIRIKRMLVESEWFERLVFC